jgi:hypothetical protein
VIASLALTITDIGGYCRSGKFDGAIERPKIIPPGLGNGFSPLTPHPTSLTSQNLDKVKYCLPSRHNSTQKAQQPTLVHLYLLAAELD